MGFPMTLPKEKQWGFLNTMCGIYGKLSMLLLLSRILGNLAFWSNLQNLTVAQGSALKYYEL